MFGMDAINFASSENPAKNLVLENAFVISKA